MVRIIYLYYIYYFQPLIHSFIHSFIHRTDPLSAGRFACHNNGSVAAGGGAGSANPSDDAALCLALEGVIQGQHEHDALVLLPAACAAAFAARSWSAGGGAAVAASSEPDDDNYAIFESNHHCVPLAVATLFSVVFGADATHSQDWRGGGAVYDSHAAFERVEEPARLLRHMSSEYLYISAQVRELQLILYYIHISLTIPN